MGIGDLVATAAARLPLYGGVRQSLERLYTPDDPAFRVDYLADPGDPGDFGPDSVTWRVMANPVAFFVGAIPAVVMQLAEEGIGKGVDTFSTYKTDTIGRSQRTLSAALATTYASRGAKKALLAEVAKRHAKVRGPLSDGGRYTAFDPERMAFVHLTAGLGFAEAYHRFVAPLSAAERERAIVESLPGAADYGRFEIPHTQAGVDDFLRSFAPRLKRRPELDNFLAVARRRSPFGRLATPLQGLIVDAGIDLLPDWVKDRLDMHCSPARRAAANAVLRSLAVLLPKLMKDTPPQLACRRMGLPDDYLFRKPGDAGYRLGAPDAAR